MSTRTTLSIFNTKSHNGLELKDKLYEIAQNEKFAVKIYKDPTMAQFTGACLKDDLVVFDGTREEDGNNIYNAATEWPKALNHVLVVSRNYLPINFFGLRREIPNGPGSREKLKGAPTYPNSLTNDEIIRWFKAQLKDLKDKGKLPRPDKEKGVFGSFSAMSNSINEVQNSRKEQGQVFISYRSRYVEDVESLAEDIKMGKYHNGERKTVRFIHPGEWAYEEELMTAQRRWQLLSMIGTEFICACDEMWIYNSPGYLDSWWTRGELATLAYHRDSNTMYTKLRLYNAKTRIVQDAPKSYIPKMDKKQIRRMERWMANSDPSTMGPEAKETMRLLAMMPLIGKWGYLNDPVWSKEFWEDLLMPNNSSSDSKIENGFDIDSFLWLREPPMLAVSLEQIQDSLRQNGHLILPSNKTVYKIAKRASRYLWMRAQASVKREGPEIVEIPIYIKENMEQVTS